MVGAPSNPSPPTSSQPPYYGTYGGCMIDLAEILIIWLNMQRPKT